VALAADEHFQLIAVGGDRSVPAGSIRCVRSEIPIEAGLDDGTEFRIDLREVERCAELRDAKHVGDPGRLDRVVGIDEARVVKCTPRDDSADPRIRVERAAE